MLLKVSYMLLLPCPIANDSLVLVPGPSCFPQSGLSMARCESCERIVERHGRRYEPRELAVDRMRLKAHVRRIYLYYRNNGTFSCLFEVRLFRMPKQH